MMSAKRAMWLSGCQGKTSLQIHHQHAFNDSIHEKICFTFRTSTLSCLKLGTISDCAPGSSNGRSSIDTEHSAGAPSWGAPLQSTRTLCDLSRTRYLETCHEL